MKPGRNPLLLLVAGLLVAALGGVILSEWRQGQARLEEIAVTTAADRSHPGAQALASLPPRNTNITRYKEIVARPLFSKGRRPPATEGVAGVERPSEIDKLVLTGIVTGPDTRVAMLLNTQSKKEVRLAEGQSYNGWKLKSFSKGEVTFAHNGRTRTLPLRKKAKVHAGVPKRAMSPTLRRNPYLSRSKRMQTRNGAGGQAH
jgi:hypothetical protein